MNLSVKNRHMYFSRWYNLIWSIQNLYWQSIWQNREKKIYKYVKNTCTLEIALNMGENLSQVDLLDSKFKGILIQFK